MAITISLLNNKGGVAKTTSTAVFAELLAYLKYKVLVVDLDEQSNLSMYFHTYSEDSEDIISGLRQSECQNICELFKYRYRTKEEIKTLIKATYINGIDIIPSSKRHGRTVLELTLNTGNNNIVLKRALKTIKDDYDFILIDNAPASNILTVNSMFASDYILTPVNVEQFSFKGLKETLSSILYIKEEHDLEDIKFLGAFITRADMQTIAFKNGKNMFETALGSRIFKTAIHRDTKINEANQTLCPLLSCKGDNNAVVDYAKLLIETKLLNKDKAEMLLQCIK